jgi:hypothetical protein
MMAFAGQFADRFDVAQINPVEVLGVGALEENDPVFIGVGAIDLMGLRVDPAASGVLGDRAVEADRAVEPLVLVGIEELLAEVEVTLIADASSQVDVVVGGARERVEQDAVVGVFLIDVGGAGTVVRPSVSRRHGGARRGEVSSGKTCHLKTEEVLAKEFKVAPRTIRNDRDFARDVDKIAGRWGNDIKNALLAGDVKLTRVNVHKVTEMQPEEQDSVVPKLLAKSKVDLSTLGDEEPSPGKTGMQRAKLLMPVDPEELAQFLLRLKGPAYAEKVQQAIGTILAEHQAKQEGKGKTPLKEDKPNRKGASKVA